MPVWLFDGLLGLMIMIIFVGLIGLLWFVVSYRHLTKDQYPPAGFMQAGILFFQPGTQHLTAVRVVKHIPEFKLVDQHVQDFGPAFTGFTRTKLTQLVNIYLAEFDNLDQYQITTHYYQHWNLRTAIYFPLKMWYGEVILTRKTTISPSEKEV